MPSRMAEAEKAAPPPEQRHPSLAAWPSARWSSLRPKVRRVGFVDGGDHDYAAALEPEAAAPAMADVVRQARLLSVQQVRMLSEPTDSVEELLFEKSLRDSGLSRDDFDSKSTASSRGKSNSNLLALQVWSAEHHFSDADRMTLAAHFVQQALDRNDVCHVRSSTASSSSAATHALAVPCRCLAEPHQPSPLERPPCRARACLQVRWDSPWAQRAYYLHTRRSWRLLVLLGAAAMYLLVLFEPKGSTWQARHHHHHSHRRLSQCRGRDWSRGRGRGRGLTFAAGGLGHPKPKPEPKPKPTPRPEPTPEPPLLTAEGLGWPWGEGHPMQALRTPTPDLSPNVHAVMCVRCGLWQVAPEWGALVGEGVLLSLLLLNLSLPCYYSGARDFLSRRIHQLE